MAQQIADRRDIDFVLHELLEIEKLTETEKFGEFNRKAFDLILNEARRFAIKEMCTNHWFDITNAKEILGYEPRVSYAEGFK